MIAQWPEFIYSLPEADLPLDTIRGWLMTSGEGQVLFLEVLEDTTVGMHTHGAQWGTVVEGEVRLTVGDEEKISHPGDSYDIPAGVPHGALLLKGSRAIDVFEERDRYNTKK